MKRTACTLVLILFAATSTANSTAAETENGAALSDDLTVTLVTGDRVVIPDDDLDQARVEPAEGREGISFQISSAADQLEVVPSDASRSLASQTLDSRLFDVSLLVESGYDDASSDTVPLIAAAPAAPDASAAAGTALTGAGATLTRELPAINGTAAEVDKDQAAQFWSAMTSGEAQTLQGVERIWLDGTGHTSLDESTELVGAPAAWDAGLTGEGVTIAILDSGIDESHPDLTGRIAAAENFTEEEAGDFSGHGTLVASAVAGTGAASDGTYRGMASGATLLNGKVTNGEGGFRESAVIEGMHWAADQGAHVANLSLGAEVQAGTIPHPFEEAANTLTEHAGTLFVAAAGNAGLAEGTVEAPASAESAIGVGAVTKDGEVWDQSSPGPRAGTAAVKPDLMAPGVEVTGARASDGYIGVPVNENYLRDSGTSISSPIVAGAAALLLEANPDLNPGEVKRLLMASADPRTGASAYEQGAGLLDVAAAIDQTITTDPASVDFGVRDWPHEDDEPVDRTVTYTNAGNEDVQLELSVAASGPGGEAPPQGMFTLADSELTVPAGGTAETTLTADTSLGGPNGLYSGHLTAASGDGTTVTPFGVLQEAELYDVTLTFTDRAGEPADNYSARLQDHDEEQQWWFVGERDGAEATVRIPPGRYYIDARFDIPDEGLALLVYPFLEVTEDISVEVDARAAAPITVALPDESTELQSGLVGYELQLDDDSRRFSSDLVGLTGDYIGHLGPQLEPDQLEGRAVGFWSTDSDDLYALAWYEGGRVHTGVQRDVRRHDLATLRLHAFSEGENQTGSGEVVSTGPFRGVQISGALPEVGLPATMDVHFSTGDETWQVQLEPEPNQRILYSVPTSYQPGRWQVERWNAAVAGPGLVSPDGSAAVTRRGDVVDVEVPLQTDSAGHPGTATSIDLLETRTALYADGELVDEHILPGSGQFDVPSGATTLRLETTMVRLADAARLSTKVEAAWTFESEPGSGDEPQPLPLSVVRFSPDVDRHNRMPARPVALVPVSVEAQPGTPEVPADQLTVEASHDDGETWTEAPVLRFGHSWRALIWHDRDAPFVSLRANATDAEGNTVEQTIIRAYELAQR